MREKKFGKLFLTWLLAATMVLTLLPVGPVKIYAQIYLQAPAE